MSQLTCKRLVHAAGRRVKQRLALFSARKDSQAALRRSSGKRLLVLCYGNIYRSPLVAYLLARDPRLEGFAIDSAGFYPEEGRPCEPRYLQLLAQRGYDLSFHRSSVVDETRLAAASLVIIMDRHNRGLLGPFGQTIIDKTDWLGSFGDRDSDEVEDPYNRPDADVLRIVGQLEDGADRLAAALAAFKTPSRAGS